MSIKEFIFGYNLWGMERFPIFPTKEKRQKAVESFIACTRIMTKAIVECSISTREAVISFADFNNSWRAWREDEKRRNRKKRLSSVGS